MSRKEDQEGVRKNKVERSNAVVKLRKEVHLSKSKVARCQVSMRRLTGRKEEDRVDLGREPLGARTRQEFMEGQRVDFSWIDRVVGCSRSAGDLRWQGREARPSSGQGAKITAQVALAGRMGVEGTTRGRD